MYPPCYVPTLKQAWNFLTGDSFESSRSAPVDKKDTELPEFSSNEPVGDHLQRFCFLALLSYDPADGSIRVRPDEDVHNADRKPEFSNTIASSALVSFHALGFKIQVVATGGLWYVSRPGSVTSVDNPAS